MTEQFDPGRMAAEGPYVAVQDHRGDTGQQDDTAAAMDGAMTRIFGDVGTLFEGCIADMSRLERRLRRGETEELKEAVVLARALRHATQNLIDERNRVDKLRKDVGGGCGGAGSLDLDAAREEIGRRLACLRRAGGG